MVFQIILLVIVVHNSSHSFRSTCSRFLQAIIQIPMYKVSVSTRLWRNIFVVSSTWLIFCTWLNSLTTIQTILLRDIPHFSQIRVFILVERWTNIQKFLIHTTILHNLRDAQITHKRIVDCHHLDFSNKFHVGDCVWLQQNNINTTRPCGKLDYQRFVLYVIIGKISDVAFCLGLTPHMCL